MVFLGGSSSPAGQLSLLCIEGSFQDNNKIRELAAISDVVTTEIEHVNTLALEELEINGYKIHPNFSTLRLIQDKYNQKVHLSKNNIPLPEFLDCLSFEDAKLAGLKLGYPLMLKNKKLAYDGRGNAVAKTEEDLEEAWKKLGGVDIYAEKWVPFIKEIAVMIVRTKSNVLSYPVVETIQENNICHLVIAPAQISAAATKAAKEIALKAIASFNGIGIYGVELFLLPDDSLIVNEIAPR